MNKKFGCIAVVLISLLTFTKSTLAQEWFEDGTLANSVLSEWQQADNVNKVATSFLWITGRIGKESYLKVIAASEEIAKRMAEQVAQCVDALIPSVVDSGFALTKEKSQGIALLCMESFEEDSWKVLSESLGFPVRAL